MWQKYINQSNQYDPVDDLPYVDYDYDAETGWEVVTAIIIGLIIFMNVVALLAYT